MVPQASPFTFPSSLISILAATQNLHIIPFIWKFGTKGDYTGKSTNKICADTIINRDE